MKKLPCFTCLIVFLEGSKDARAFSEVGTRAVAPLRPSFRGHHGLRDHVDGILESTRGRNAVSMPRCGSGRSLVLNFTKMSEDTPPERPLGRLVKRLVEGARLISKKEDEMETPSGIGGERNATDTSETKGRYESTYVENPLTSSMNEGTGQEGVRTRLGRVVRPFQALASGLQKKVGGLEYELGKRLSNAERQKRASSIGKAGLEGGSSSGKEREASSKRLQEAEDQLTRLDKLQEDKEVADGRRAKLVGEKRKASTVQKKSAVELDAEVKRANRRLQQERAKVAETEKAAAAARASATSDLKRIRERLQKTEADLKREREESMAEGVRRDRAEKEASAALEAASRTQSSAALKAKHAKDAEASAAASAAREASVRSEEAVRGARGEAAAARAEAEAARTEMVAAKAEVAVAKAEAGALSAAVERAEKEANGERLRSRAEVKAVGEAATRAAEESRRFRVAAEENARVRAREAEKSKKEADGARKEALAARAEEVSVRKEAEAVRAEVLAREKAMQAEVKRAAEEAEAARKEVSMARREAEEAKIEARIQKEEGERSVAEVREEAAKRIAEAEDESGAARLKVQLAEVEVALEDKSWLAKEMELGKTAAEAQSKRTSKGLEDLMEKNRIRYKRALEKLQTEVKELSLLKDAAAGFEEMRTRLNLSKSKEVELETRADVLRKQVEILESELLSSSAQSEANALALKEREGALMSAEAQLKKALDTGVELENATTRVKELEGCLSEAEEGLAVERLRADKLEEMVDKAMGKEDEVKEKMFELERTAEVVEWRGRQLERENKGLQGLMERNRSRFQKELSRLTEASADLAEKTEAVKGLESALDKEKALSKQLDREVNELKERTSAMASELMETRDRLAQEMEARLRSESALRLVANRSYEERLRKADEDLEKEKLRSQVEVDGIRATLEQERKQWEVKATSFEAQIQEERKKLETAKSQVGALESVREQLSEKANTLQEKLSQAKEWALSAASDKTLLEQSIAKLEAALNQAKKETAAALSAAAAATSSLSQSSQTVAATDESNADASSTGNSAAFAKDELQEENENQKGEAQGTDNYLRHAGGNGNKGMEERGGVDHGDASAQTSRNLEDQKLEKGEGGPTSEAGRGVDGRESRWGKGWAGRRKPLRWNKK